MSADGVFEKMTMADQWAAKAVQGQHGHRLRGSPAQAAHAELAVREVRPHADSTAISESAKNGLRLFIGKASCLDCHNGPALSDNQFHNIGVPTPAVFPPGSTTAGVADRGRGGVLVAQLNNQLMNLRTNDNLPDPMTQVPIFGGAGQFSDTRDRSRPAAPRGPRHAAVRHPQHHRG